MAEEAPKPASSGGKETTMAVLAHVLGIIVGFIGPLIIYLVANNDPYGKSQAKEALNFQITVLIGWVVGGILTMILIGTVVLAVVGIANLILSIMAAIAASKGEDYRYPFAIRLIK